MYKLHLPSVYTAAGSFSIHTQTSTTSSFTMHTNNAMLGDVPHTRSFTKHTRKRSPQQFYDGVGLRFLQTSRRRFPFPPFDISQDPDWVYVASVASKVDDYVIW